MSSKKWIMTFFLTLLLIGVMIAAFNMLVDPFGVFGDVIFRWDSYSQTRNPRVGKTEYLRDHWQEYDSYIVGCSSTSSYPVEDLNKYFGASFYNLFSYGADMLDAKQTVNYLIENYTVKNIVLNVYIDNGAHYDEGEDTLQNLMHYKVSGKSPLPFYLRFMAIDPQYSAAKIKDYYNDTELTQPFDVFNTETGAYDKRVRDIEPIGDMETYLEAYPVFGSYPSHSIHLTETEKTVSAVREIKEACDRAGVNLTVFCAPCYVDYLRYFDIDEVESFYTGLADVTEFWDFTMSSVSCEPRYFYDGTHFRNCVGSMALARVFGDESLYIPEDFGIYVTPENVSAVVRGYPAYYGKAENEGISRRVPILMYHDIDETGDNDATISVDCFRRQIKAVSEAGYTAITFDELIDYVDKGTPLPEKPVIITFDDGYYSNYEYAFPILKEYGMKATVFVIGVSVGSKEHYKDTEYPITPHFDENEMREMVSSGVFSIQTHTYDMHQWAPYESGEARESVKMLPGETEEEYISAIMEDLSAAKRGIEPYTGEEVRVLAYPNGVYDDISQWVFTENGIRSTLSTRGGVNTVVKGIPQTLYAMRRITVSDLISEERLLQIME